MVPRTGPLSASSARATTSWYQRGKSSARGVSAPLVAAAFPVGGRPVAGLSAAVMAAHVTGWPPRTRRGLSPRRCSRYFSRIRSIFTAVALGSSPFSSSNSRRSASASASAVASAAASRASTPSATSLSASATRASTISASGTTRTIFPG